METVGTDSANGSAVRPLSLRAYSRRRGTSVESVRRAINSGRLKASLTTDARGETKIADPDLADREWAANTDPTRAPIAVKVKAFAAKAASVTPPVTGRRDTVTPPSEPRQPVDVSSGDDAEGSLSFQVALAREKEWKARLAELDYRTKVGELVPAREVEQRLVDAITMTKTKLLALPSKIKAAIPTLTHLEVSAIDTLVRESLEELAAVAPPKPPETLQ